MKHKVVTPLMVFFGLLLSISIAHAQIYKWRDEHGNIGLTDDFSTWMKLLKFMGSRALVACLHH